MANVKCPYCGELFNRDKTDFQVVRFKGANRYAHTPCVKKHEQALAAEQKPKDELNEVLKKIYQVEATTTQHWKQVNAMKKNLNYTYVGMRHTLEYAMDIKGMKVFSINIIPTLYEEAQRHYEQIDAANESNKIKMVDVSTNDNRITVVIPVPLQKNNRKRRLFSFLDEE